MEEVRVLVENKFFTLLLFALDKDTARQILLQNIFFNFSEKSE